MCCEVDHNAATRPTTCMHITLQEAPYSYSIDHSPFQHSTILPQELSPSCLCLMLKACL